MTSRKTRVFLLRAITLSLVSTLLPAPMVSAGDACCKTPPPASEPPAEPPGLTGDWGGLRSTLKQKGFDFSADYVVELFGNPTGGIQRGAVVNGLARLFLEVDLEKTVGWNGAAFRVSGLYAHGTSGSLRNVGDAAFFSSIDAYDSVRLIDFWIEQRLLEDKLSLRVGQTLADTEFGVAETAAPFINSIYGVPTPPITPMGFAAYPVAALGVRLRVEPVKGLYGMAGIYDGNPSPGDFPDPSTPGAPLGSNPRHGTDWALRASEGATVATEVGFQRSEGSHPGAYRVGLVHHTDDFAEVRYGSATVRKNSTSGFYVLDQTLWRKTEGSKEGVAAFVRGTLAEASTSFMNHSLQMGAVYTGFLSSEDKIGVAVGRSTFSAGQVASIRGADYPLTRENVAELTYLIPLKPHLRVQPDVQYISRPGGIDAYKGAWVVGVRAIMEF